MSGRSTPAAAAQLAKSVLADAHAGQRIVDVRIEARRDEHELRLEALHRGLDDVGERVQILLVPRARRQRHVERRLALLVRPAGAGIERPLVERGEEHRVVVPERRLRPVPVVHVEVDDRHALASGCARRDRDVVEDAEAHRAIGQRMMAGRPHEREATAARRLDRRSGGERRSLEGRVGRDRVAVEPDALVDAADALHVLARVHEEELVLGRGPALAPHVLVVEQHPEPFRPVGMVPGRMESRERGMGQDVDRTISASRSTSPPARPSR